MNTFFFKKNTDKKQLACTDEGVKYVYAWLFIYASAFGLEFAVYPQLTELKVVGCQSTLCKERLCFLFDDACTTVIHYCVRGGVCECV